MGISSSRPRVSVPVSPSIHLSRNPMVSPCDTPQPSKDQTAWETSLVVKTWCSWCFQNTMHGKTIQNCMFVQFFGVLFILPVRLNFKILF